MTITDWASKARLPWTCVCGRDFAKRAGLLVHGRSCVDETQRSADFSTACETGDWTTYHLTWGPRLRQAGRSS